jgi:biotin carboxyl carrier protein
MKGAGDDVEEGEAVVVVEAMKMQNEVSSPLKGTIVSCDLSEGASISTGEILFEVSNSPF